MCSTELVALRGKRAWHDRRVAHIALLHGPNLNLLGAMNNLLPQSGPVQQLQAPDVMGAYKNQYDAQMANYMAKQQGWQNALKLGVGLATTPWTGGVTAAGDTKPGLSNSLLGMGLTKLFNGT